MTPVDLAWDQLFNGDLLHSPNATLASLRDRWFVVVLKGGRAKLRYNASGRRRR